MSDLIQKYAQDWKRDENGVILIPDEFLEKMAVKQAANKVTFSQLGDKYTQPKHKGTKMVKEVQLPVLHPDNRIDNGLNANAATFLKNVWFAYDGITKQQVGNAEGYATESDALDACTNDGQPKSGAGNVYYGDADYTTLVNGVPELGEEGGNVNAVNSTSKYISAKIKKRGIHYKWTVDSMNQDNRPGLLLRKNKDLAEACRDLREAELQADLLAQAENAVMFPYGGNASKTALMSDDVLSFKTLEAFELKLKKFRVPTDTTVITGSTKQGTKVVSKAWYIYVPQEIVPALRAMEDNGIRVYEPVESYMDAAKGNIAQDEIGRIGSFRFIEVFNMQRYKGAGAQVDDGDGGADEGKPTYETTIGDERHHDVFPLLFVGNDSFASVGYEGSSLAIKTAMPKADANNDPFGEKGSIAIKWWHGFMAYRPERIRAIYCTIRK
jgi:N4-gp56 family major capsid protein